jgi:hypothetical protein
LSKHTSGNPDRSRVRPCVRTSTSGHGFLIAASAPGKQISRVPFSSHGKQKSQRNQGASPRLLRRHTLRQLDLVSQLLQIMGGFISPRLDLGVQYCGPILAIVQNCSKEWLIGSENCYPMGHYSAFQLLADSLV